MCSGLFGETEFGVRASRASLARALRTLETRDSTLPHSRTLRESGVSYAVAGTRTGTVPSFGRNAHKNTSAYGNSRTATGPITGRPPRRAAGRGLVDNSADGVGA